MPFHSGLLPAFAERLFPELSAALAVHHCCWKRDCPTVELGTRTETGIETGIVNFAGHETTAGQAVVLLHLTAPAAASGAPVHGVSALRSSVLHGETALFVPWSDLPAVAPVLPACLFLLRFVRHRLRCSAFHNDFPIDPIPSRTAHADLHVPVGRRHRRHHHRLAACLYQFD